MDLREGLPVDHRLTAMHRVGAAWGGVTLLLLGRLGSSDRPLGVRR
ncbi:hypothetical protein [Streptomyces sp. NPDC001568]